MDSPEHPEELSLDDLVEEHTLTLPSLNVNVDFNDLIMEKGLEESYEIIGKLKDLLA